MNKVDFIAEVSSNHNRDLKRTLKTNDSIKKSGFTSIKFNYLKLMNFFKRNFRKIFRT